MILKLKGIFGILLKCLNNTLTIDHHETGAYIAQEKKRMERFYCLARRQRHKKNTVYEN